MFNYVTGSSISFVPHDVISFDPSDVIIVLGYDVIALHDYFGVVDTFLFFSLKKIKDLCTFKLP